MKKVAPQRRLVRPSDEGAATGELAEHSYPSTLLAPGAVLDTPQHNAGRGHPRQRFAEPLPQLPKGIVTGDTRRSIKSP